MKVLILNRDAQFREALEAQLTVRRRAFDVFSHEWLQQAASPALLIPEDIGVVVNVASLECLQYAADDRPLEELVALARACKQADIPLLQLSTSQVFDGAGSGRHREDEEVLANSPLGDRLVSMEALIRAECERYIILRTGPVFSSDGNNVLTQLVTEFNQHAPLQFSKTGKSCPVHARDVARVVSAIIDQLSCGSEPWGLYHYSSTEAISHYQFAEAVLAVVSQYTDVSDATLLQPLDEIDKAWRWPLLNCEKILHTFGIKQLPWRTYIVPTIKTLFNQPAVEAGHE